MDWLKGTEKTASFLKRYRVVLLTVALGLILMSVPGTKTASAEPEKAEQQLSLQSSLEQLLGKMEGAGKVAVLLTEKQGEEIFYQTDLDHTSADTSGSSKEKTVLITDSQRGQTGLIRKIDPPVLQGAVILCQGGDDPKVRLSIVEAVMAATGLPSNCITVLKMK